PVPSAAELQLFRDLLASRSGIDFGRYRESFLESRLRRRMREAGARSLYEYYRMVTAPGGEHGELQVLVDEVSIHQTHFCRNAPQFQTLEAMALPERVSTRLTQGRRRLYLWSAGCSSGQEPYSVAMSLFENTVLPETWDVRLMGTDISAQVLRQARRATYTAAQMGGVSPERQRRFFDKKGDTFAVRPWLRQRVEFRHGSLLEGPPTLDLDVIFCRNVMIYFDRATQRRLIALLARALAPGGYLFLGHTETLAGLSEGFRMVPRAQ